MAKTIATVENILAGSSSKFDRWYRNFEAEYRKPDIDLAIASVIKSMPPEVLAQARAKDPQAFDSVMRKFKLEV